MLENKDIFEIIKNQIAEAKRKNKRCSSIEWRKIDGSDGKLEISNQGQIREYRSKKVLPLLIDSDGYKYFSINVKLSQNKVKVNNESEFYNFIGIDVKKRYDFKKYYVHNAVFNTFFEYISYFNTEKFKFYDSHNRLLKKGCDSNPKIPYDEPSLVSHINHNKEMNNVENLYYCRLPKDSLRNDFFTIYYCKFEKEIWIDIGLEPARYKISNTGKIKNTITDSFVELNAANNDLLYANLEIDSTGCKKHFIHQLVVKYFFDIKLKNSHIYHIDGHKENNRVDNLIQISSKTINSIKQFEYKIPLLLNPKIEGDDFGKTFIDWLINNNYCTFTENCYKIQIDKSQKNIIDLLLKFKNLIKNRRIRGDDDSIFTNHFKELFKIITESNYFENQSEEHN